MRAIILAAGMGTRLRPITNTIPKSLVPVNGIPMAEKQIQFLLEKGINDITVVTGYLAEKFDYLVEKYGVKLVHNKMYNKYNNLYTMYLVRHLLDDCFVLEGDVYMDCNFINTNIETSVYYAVKREKFSKEWILTPNKENKIIDIRVEDGENLPIVCGLSYWMPEDARLIRSKMEQIFVEGNFTEYYWDDVVRLNIQDLNVYLYEVDSSFTYEIDTVEELHNVENILQKRLKSSV